MKCCTCNVDKPTDHFSPDKRVPSGLRHECKECNNSRRKQKRIERREFIHAYKLEQGCAICGYNASAVALQFDHIEPSTKSFNISSAVSNRSKEVIEEEIKKCRVLCANCHAIHTHEEKL